MLPVGVLVGVALGALGVVLARRAPASPLTTTMLAAAGVAVTRSIASVWLPRLGDGLTRPHRASIAISGLAGAGLVAEHLTRGRALR